MNDYTPEPMRLITRQSRSALGLRCTQCQQPVERAVQIESDDPGAAAEICEACLAAALAMIRPRALTVTVDGAEFTAAPSIDFGAK